MSTELTTTQILQGLSTVQAVLAPDLSADELRLFAMVANRSGLDPFAKQIYAVKRKGRVTFQTGIDGYRSIAARTGMYDGQDEPEYGPPCQCGDKRPEGHPEYATVRVYRKGVGRAIAATAYWHEYKPAQGDKDRPQDAMWVRMPRVMLAKVAEALALRKAFPWDPNAGTGIGADLYTADEMTQAESQASRAETAPTTARERVAARAQVRRLPAPEPKAWDGTADAEASAVYVDSQRITPEPETEQPPETVEGELVEAGTAADQPEGEPTDEEVRHAFLTATALIPREQVSEAARKTFPGVASARYTARHWRAVADALGVSLELTKGEAA